MLDPPLDRARDHVVGPDAVPVLVEYGDFECPYCGRAFGAIKDALAQLEGRAAFAFRHFPLGHKHPHAQRAAEAAEAAAEQGRFWEMHDRLFEHQDAIADDDLVAYARELGLDVQRFERELREGVHARRVHEDRLSGERSGVTGTPAFFIDGERYEGYYDAESLVWALEDAAGR